jgi:hypothetical protein
MKDGRDTPRAKAKHERMSAAEGGCRAGARACLDLEGRQAAREEARDLESLRARDGECRA